MRIIRSRAKTYGIDPERVGAMGFSAGGHLCADLGTRFAVKTYEPVDEVDKLSARPAIAAPIYPVISMRIPDAHPGSREKLLGSNPAATEEQKHSPHLHVPDNAPPFFVLHAEDVAVGCVAGGAAVTGAETRAATSRAMAADRRRAADRRMVIEGP
jgi:acetyl esterase/lipase